jgi:Tol biopolymer transport system component
MVERTPEGWREPQVLPSPLNSDYRDGSYTESADGVVYISSKRPDGFGGYDIWRIQPNSSQSLQAENLGSIINSSAFDVSPLIAPDGSYLIFGSERDGRKGLAQLYISFKKDNGEWSSPINMNSCGAKINNETAHHSGPSLSPDGKYLFFRRHEAMMEMDVYWVNARVIEKLRNKVVEEYSSQELINLKGDYLGQPLPGEMPVVFAPGVVSTDTTIEHGSPTFSPDGNEVFWQSNYRQSGKETQIFGMTMKRIENQWTAPTISPYDSGPVFSVDGKRLYYLPFGEANGEKNGPYFIEKEGKKWSQPVCMELVKQFPDIKVVYNHSFTSNNTIYFLGYAEGYWANFGIYRSELIDGKYAQPELLPDEINVPGTIRNWTPFIAPDESYLLFSSSRRNPKTDAGDIYVTFRKSDKSWTAPVSLGDKINTNRQERFPSVSPDGKYLFFTRWVERGNEDVMWVSAAIIDKLKIEVFNNTKRVKQ